MESQTEAKSEAKSDPPVASKQELDEMIPEEINGGIITATKNIEIKKEPREEETNTTEVNQSTMDFENFIGNNDPINIKSEDVNTIIDTDEKETYQHMMIGAGISLEDEVEKKPQLNLKGEVIDMEPGDVKDEPAEESSESSSSEEDSSEESTHPFLTPQKGEIKWAFNVNKLWKPKTGNQTPQQEKKYVCSTCGYQNDLFCRMQKHQIVHSEKRFQCDKCSMRTRYKSSLQKHVETVHRDPSTVSMLACNVCSFKTHSNESLRLHMINHTAEPKKPKVEMYKCELCDFKAKKKCAVLSHVNIHRPPSERDVYKCELCPYTSKFKGGVSNHMNVHKKPSETTMYECEVCPFKTKWPHCLRNHLKTHKKKEVPVHECEHCDFKANNKYSVTTHQKSVHKLRVEKPKKEKKYKCDLCDYTGRSSYNLNKHKIIHETITRAELFTCAICGSQMKRKKTLKNHILKLHGYLERHLDSTSVNISQN